ncbi:MAG TPA: EAL domain-containing protein [Holophaga sp.]|nr:EAL domain-containing protein [Holophaga sp.]
MDLGTGGVAGIEATRVRTSRRDVLFPYLYGSADRIVSPAQDAFGAWGSEVREPAAYLVRGQLTAATGRIGETLGVAAERIILMYDLAALFREPARAQEALVAAKRAGARILLDVDDLDDPPARFLEMLPADILRVAPGRMPWHWDEARRREAMASLMRFAENLLMDVAVEGVAGGEKRRELKRLGVRYAQGGWRRDTRGLVPDPGRS